MRALPPLLPGLSLEPVKAVKPSVGRPLTASGRAKKGFRVEREMAELFEQLGVAACRVRQSGALASRLGPAFAGDLRIWALGRDAPPLTAEVKSRGNGASFAVLERWLGNHDVLILKRNNLAPLIAMPWATWAAILARKGGEE